MRSVNDSYSDSVANPNDPPRRVVAGNRSSDEMAHLWLQVLPHTSPDMAFDPRMLLQEALARHNVEKNPADFEAHYNLGAMLQARGNLDAALAEYEAAVKLRPEDATGNNALGAALVEGGRPAQAVSYLQAALKARAD